MRRAGPALFMAALLVLYIVVVGVRAYEFIQTGLAIGIAIGIALIVVFLLGAYLLYRELAFGLRSGRLVSTLEAEGGLPVDDLPRRPSGRVDRAAADLEFDRYRADTESAPDDWRSWLRLGLAYDASGDRRRAREAVRRAISLSRA